MKVQKKATSVVALMSAVVFTIGNQPIQGAERKLREVRPIPANYYVGKVTTSVPKDRVETSKKKILQLFQCGKLKVLLSDRQIEALIQVESTKRNGLVGDKHLGKTEQAYGILQIRQCYVTDVNRNFGTDLQAIDCQWDIGLSITVAQAYMNLYAKPGFGFEHFARMHNGGPNGYNPKFGKIYRKTSHYWAKVKKALNR